MDMSENVVILILGMLLLSLFAFGVLLLVASICGIVKQAKVNAGTATARRGNRFTQVVAFTGDYQRTGAAIHEFLTRCGYLIQSYGNETVYRNGSGMFAAAKFIKISMVPGGIQVEAFIVGFNFIRLVEMGLTGFFGFVIKKRLKVLVEELINLIEADERTRRCNQYQPQCQNPIQ